MKRRQKLGYCKIAVLVITVLLTHGLNVFGQTQNIQMVYIVTDAQTETLRTVYVGKGQENNNEANIFVGTNTGRVLTSKVNSNNSNARLDFRLIESKDGLIRDLYFTHPNKGYILKTDGIYKFEFVRERFSMKPFVKVETFSEEENSVPRLYTMAFVKGTSKVCIGGTYVVGNTDEIDKQLLLCTNDITEDEPEWDEPDMPGEAKIQITSLNFADSQNGWAVGTEGTIWITRDGGKKWKKEEVKFQNKNVGDAFMSVFGLEANRAWAVGYNSQVWSRSGATNSQVITSGQTRQEICVKDIVRIKEEALERAQIFVAGVDIEGVVTQVIKTSRKLRVSLNRKNLPERMPSSITKAIENFLTKELGYDDVEVIQSACALTNRTNTDDEEGQGNQKNNEAGAWSKKTVTILTKPTILRGVKFSPFDANKGWIVGDGGTILYTVNGGESWLPVQVAANFKTLIGKTNFYSIFVDENTCWITGTGGVIVRINYEPTQNRMTFNGSER